MTRFNRPGDGVLLPIPVSAATIAEALHAHPDYRVLRRLPPFERDDAGAGGPAVVHGLCLDCETTGLDCRTDRITELAMRRFGVDAEGRIVEAGRMHVFLEDPGRELSADVRAVTGLSWQDLKGRSIPDGEATSLLLDADFVTSHNAAFDRPFVERRLPLAAGRPWADSLTDVEWGALGFDGRRQGQLVAEIGGFYDAHRAANDVDALLHLLAHVLPDGTTVVSRMLDAARRPTFRLDAHRAPRQASDALRARGWRWDRDRRVWSCVVPASEVEAETDWAVIRVYGATDGPMVTRIDWTTRHAG